MFDWNDEELTNIIWDEAGESDDHIVPFPEAGEDYNKKEWSQEAGTVKSSEQKQAGVNVEVYERKLDTSSNFDSIEGTPTSGFGIDSWPKLSVTNTNKTEQDSLDTSVSNNLTEISKFDSSGRETAQLSKDTEIFQDNSEGKEQGDFVDYGWANIGSFDDLDRIFSNDDPIFGNVSLSGADELWNSSKISNSPVKSFPLSDDSPSLGLGALRNTSQNLEVKTEYVQEEEQPFNLHYGRLSDPSSHGFQTARPLLDRTVYAGSKIKALANDPADLSTVGKNTPANSQITAENVAASNELGDKAYKQKKILKNRKKHEEKNELKLYQDMYGNWSASGNPSGQFKNQFSPSILQSPTSSVLTQQRSLQGPESLQYQQISNPYATPSGCGNITNPYSGMPVMSHMQSGELTCQPLLSGYDVSSHKANPVNKTSDSMVNPQTMTPQEKIEKLRRRQQLQAMLAIQKQQQQQLGHKVSDSDPSMSHKCPQGNQIQNVGVYDLEVDDMSAGPSFDPNSPIEQDDSNTVSLVFHDCSMEDNVLYQLQEVISKLDVRIRVCIRDSLFRLAQSATQRRYASDTSSNNNSGRDEQVATKEDAVNCGRNANMPEVETETNPIDRTVAHLLFHRPLESPGKHPDTPESPVSTKLPLDPKPIGVTKLSVGSLPDSLQTKQNFSLQTSKNPCPLVDPQSISQSKSSVCLDALENASNVGPVDEETREVEASQ